MPLPSDYLERVYAGVLGKIIGVYMGRPVENMRHEQIVARYGEVRYYLTVADGQRTVVTDDDIAGTFTFVRALEDYGFDPNITSAQIGQSWLNYIIENRSIIWWGGLYHSTEHTAFLHLKNGISAPRSGSLELNGPIIANQIGAQIYIDGWAMTAPGDPQRAADLAERSARVSHDDLAIHAARLIAAMESLAFIEPGIEQLLDAGLAQIPADSLIHRLVEDVRSWRLIDQDWRRTYLRIAEKYSYSRYVGGCHIVPNHALILLGLLYGNGNFADSLAITITSGWDTDCNAGNLGCLLGIRGGLATLAGGPDWRGPLADRLFLSTADGGRCISDALGEAYHLVNTGRALQDLPPLSPKGGARFHFSLPGSLQGFQVEGKGRLENPLGNGLDFHVGSLNPEETSRAGTATFILPTDLNMPGYALDAAPTLYTGQVVQCRIAAAGENRATLQVGLYVCHYNAKDKVEFSSGPQKWILPGQAAEITWILPDFNGGPIFEIGIVVGGSGPSTEACLTMDYLGWEGCPRVELRRPAFTEGDPRPELWRRAWICEVDHWENRFNHAFRIIQNRGRGMLITGTREWRNYRLSSKVTSAIFQSGGIAACVQGLARFYALELVWGGHVRLLKVLDGDQVLAEAEFDWKIWQPYELVLAVQGSRLRGWIDGILYFDLNDDDRPLLDGGVALTVVEGHLATHAVNVEPFA